jgi:hypothetical protein
VLSDRKRKVTLFIGEAARTMVSLAMLGEGGGNR